MLSIFLPSIKKKLKATKPKLYLKIAGPYLIPVIMSAMDETNESKSGASFWDQISHQVMLYTFF